MTVHAFVDESARDGLYVVAATVTSPAQLSRVRTQVRGLLLSGQRELHFKKEAPRRKSLLADRMASLPVSVRLYVADRTPRTEEAARQRCLAGVVDDLTRMGAHRLVIDTREHHRDTADRATIQRALGVRPSKTALTYEHIDSMLEPMLWISDCVAWCYGAGSDWRRRTNALVDEVIDFRKA